MSITNLFLIRRKEENSNENEMKEVMPALTLRIDVHSRWLEAYKRIQNNTHCRQALEQSDDVQ